MKGLLLSFSEFNQKFFLSESKDSSSDGTDCIIAASNASEKEGQERFITEVSMMDYQELENLLNSTISKGSAFLSEFDNSWKKRMELDLDKGPLTRAGKWYIGEGAWRVNSAKAARLGMTPASIKYFDPMQQELLEKHFPEDYAPSGAAVSPKGEVTGLEMPKAPKAEKELELATSESFKYIKVYESDETFTLGPPESARRAVVVDSNELTEQLVDNFFLTTRENMMIWGAPGIGKTEIVRAAAKRIGDQLGTPVPVTVITLATKAKYDIQGLPLLFVEKGAEPTDPEEMKRLVLPTSYKGQIGMDFAYPAWLPPPGDTQDGILFFDEINRADAEVLGACLTLMLDRVSGTYRIPNGWRIWAAGNRDMDGPVTKMEGAMASRFLGGHYHLVPTVESWSEWARSEHAFFKDASGTTGEWYIPSEFLSFLKLKDVATATGGTISSLGKTYRVKFEYFYNWDSASAAENSGGKMEGFPTPRTWSKAFGIIYQKMKSSSDLMSKVSANVDPRMKTISMFGVALLDPKFERDLLIKLSAIVGTEAADAFIEYAKLIARYNDQDGTLVEKIENVFTNPDAPRPLIGKQKPSADEIFGILTMVEGKFDELTNLDKMGVAEFTNWAKYLLDLGDEGSVRDGDLAQLVSACLNKNRMIYKKVYAKDPQTGGPIPEITKEMLPVLREFRKRFTEVLAKMERL